MIRFNTLKFKNFITYRDWVSIDFRNKGVVWVTGINHDTGRGSNGSGKSLLADALRHILYGETSKGLKDSQIVLDKNYIGMLNFTKGEDTYEIWQYIKHDEETFEYSYKDITKEVTIKGKGYSIFKNGVEITDRGINAAKKFILGIIGITKDEFSGYVHLDPNNAPVLIEGSGPERRKYLEKSFGLSDYKLIQAELKEHHGKRKEHLEGLNIFKIELETLQSQLAETKDIDTLRVLLDKASKKLRIVENAKKEVVGNLDELKEQKFQHTKRQDVLEQLTKLSKVPDGGASDIDTKLEKLEAGIKQLESYESEWSDILCLKSEAVEIKSGLKANNITPKTFKDILAKQNQIQEKLTEYKVVAREASTFLSKLKGLDFPVCPTCDKPMDQDEIKKSIQETNSRIRLAVQESRSLKEDLQSNSLLVNLIQDYRALKDKLDDLNPPSVSSEDVQSKLVSYRDNLKKGRLLRDKILEKAILIKRLAKCSKIDIDAVLKDLTKFQRDLEDVDLEIKVFISEKVEHSVKIKNYEKLLNKANALKEKLKGYDRASRELNLLATLQLAYSDRGLKVKQISRISKNLVKLLPKYTSLMFQENNIDFVINSDKEDSFDIMVKRGKTPETKERIYDIRGLSSGEQKRFTPALMISQSDMIPQSKKTNILIADELDANLDEVGETAFSEKLLPAIKDKYETIIVIAHSSNMYSHHYDCKWLVEKRHSISKLTTEGVR